MGGGTLSFCLSFGQWEVSEVGGGGVLCLSLCLLGSGRLLSSSVMYVHVSRCTLTLCLKRCWLGELELENLILQGL